MHTSSLNSGVLDHTLGAVVMDGTLDSEEVDRMKAAVQNHSLESVVAEYWR